MVWVGAGRQQQQQEQEEKEAARRKKEKLDAKERCVNDTKQYVPTDGKAATTVDCALPLSYTHLDPTIPNSNTRVKNQRMRGQSGIGEDFKSWKTEEEMRMRQHYD